MSNKTKSDISVLQGELISVITYFQIKSYIDAIENEKMTRSDRSCYM